MVTVVSLRLTGCWICCFLVIFVDCFGLGLLFGYCWLLFCVCWRLVVWLIWGCWLNCLLSRCVKIVLFCCFVLCLTILLMLVYYLFTLVCCCLCSIYFTWMYCFCLWLYFNSVVVWFRFFGGELVLLFCLVLSCFAWSFGWLYWLIVDLVICLFELVWLLYDLFGGWVCLKFDLLGSCLCALVDCLWIVLLSCCGVCDWLIVVIVFRFVCFLFGLMFACDLLVVV